MTIFIDFHGRVTDGRSDCRTNRRSIIDAVTAPKKGRMFTENPCVKESFLPFISDLRMFKRPRGPRRRKIVKKFERGKSREDEVLTKTTFDEEKVKRPSRSAIMDRENLYRVP